MAKKNSGLVSENDVRMESKRNSSVLIGNLITNHFLWPDAWVFPDTCLQNLLLLSSSLFSYMFFKQLTLFPIIV